MPSHLFLMVILSGCLGGCIHGLRSLFWYVGNRDLRKSWLPMYYILPVSGTAIAVIFFLIASAGLYTIQGTNNFILIGLAALVGMFSAQAAEKLKKIAEGLLTTAPQGENTVPPQSSLPKKEPVTLSVTSIEPKSGTIGGSTEVTITGKGFSDGAIVSFGGKTASVKNLSPTSITVSTPDHVAGKVDVTINKDSQRFTKRDAYEYIAG